VDYEKAVLYSVGLRVIESYGMDIVTDGSYTVMQYTGSGAANATNSTNNNSTSNSTSNSTGNTTTLNSTSNSTNSSSTSTNSSSSAQSNPAV
jgi:hypothetical protein